MTIQFSSPFIKSHSFWQGKKEEEEDNKEEEQEQEKARRTPSWRRSPEGHLRGEEPDWNVVAQTT